MSKRKRQDDDGGGGISGLGMVKNVRGGNVVKMPNSTVCCQPVLAMIDSSVALLKAERGDPAELLSCWKQHGYLKFNVEALHAPVDAARLKAEPILKHHPSLHNVSPRAAQSKGRGILRVGVGEQGEIAEIDAVQRVQNEAQQQLARIFSPAKNDLFKFESFYRILGRGRYTQQHCDSLYLQNTYGCPWDGVDVVTVWVNMDDYKQANGVLAILPGSHWALLDDTNDGVSLPIPRYREFETKLPRKYFTAGGAMPWHIGDYKKGDMVIFDSRTIHCTSVNDSDVSRMSTDFRFVVKPKRVTPTWWKAMESHLERCHY